MRYLKKRKYLNKKKNKYKYIYFKEYKNGKQVQIKKEEYYKKKQKGGQIVQKGGPVAYVSPINKLVTSNKYVQRSKTKDMRVSRKMKKTMPLKNFLDKNYLDENYLPSKSRSLLTRYTIPFKSPTFRIISVRVNSEFETKIIYTINESRIFYLTYKLGWQNFKFLQQEYDIGKLLESRYIISNIELEQLRALRFVKGKKYEYQITYDNYPKILKLCTKYGNRKLTTVEKQKTFFRNKIESLKSPFKIKPFKLKGIELFFVPNPEYLSFLVLDKYSKLELPKLNFEKMIDYLPDDFIYYYITEQKKKIGETFF